MGETPSADNLHVQALPGRSKSPQTRDQKQDSTCRSVAGLITARRIHPVLRTGSVGPEQVSKPINSVARRNPSQRRGLRTTPEGSSVSSTAQPPKEAACSPPPRNRHQQPPGASPSGPSGSTSSLQKQEAARNRYASR